MDIPFWRDRGPLKFADLVKAAMSDAVSSAPHVLRFMLIRDNTITFPLMPKGPKQTECSLGCDPQLADLVNGLQVMVDQYRLTLPNMALLVNVDDLPPCTFKRLADHVYCKVPYISIGKEPNLHPDLMAPAMLDHDARVETRNLTWDKKLARAYFRGSATCGRMRFEKDCARTWVARLSSTNFSDRIDAGLIFPYGRPDELEGDSVLRDGNGPLPVLQRAPLSVLPKYRYLLALDGHVAPYRLAVLLATDSVVLKQRSHWLEWYYRSLRPWVHYIPILEASEWDIFGAMAWVDGNQAAAQAIVARAQRFSMRYATYKARLLYWLYTLTAYKGLFEDMDEWVGKTRGRDPEGVRQLLLNAFPGAAGGSGGGDG